MARYRFLTSSVFESVLPCSINQRDNNLEASQNIVEQVRDACARRLPLKIQGGDSKSFYGNPCEGDVLDTTVFRGITSYEPTELVITAAAGTPLREVEKVLAEQGQYLPFEPPAHSAKATIGGAIASGLSGPRRPWTGSVRDFVLGVKCINGRGELLKFGGQVIKNVAGYDVSRLLTGSLGTLAVITEVSLKVLPKPETELALLGEMSLQEAREFMQNWSRRPVPLSGASYYQGRLRIRLSGYDTAVRHTASDMGLGIEPNLAFWEALRHQAIDCLQAEGPVWRISVPSTTDGLQADEFEVMDWGGALYWSLTATPAETLRERIRAMGGHATLYRDKTNNAPRFQPLSPGLLALHKRIKAAFDPVGILNRGRMYPEY